jgi:type IV secretory pathway VirB9-like protein
VNQNVPAIFIINENGNEAIVNTRTRGNWKVVERVYTGFSLRYDNQAAKVFNENPPLALAGGK